MRRFTVKQEVKHLTKLSQYCTLWEIYMSLSKLWTDLTKIPVNNIGQITEPFIHFDPGTYVEDIWLWFEEQDDNFSVAAHLYPKEEIVVCPYHG